MADQLEYIVRNALMMCDKEAAPAFFLPTHNTHIKIQRCLIANKHPFFTENDWKDTADLQTGDRIKSRNKEDVEIKDVKFSYKPRKVYNFEVSNWHTYFVRVLAWIVHNAKNVFPEL